MKDRSLLMTGIIAAMAMAEDFGAGFGAPKPININAGRNDLPHRPKGLTQFWIDGEEIWAINYKNALRKHKVK